MTSSELLRRLRRLGAEIDRGRGKGGHVMARLGGRFAMVPTGSGDLPTGTLRAILRELGLRPEDLLGGEMSHVYSALLEPESEGGFTVTFPEIGFGATYGATWAEALRQAGDMLEEAVLGLIAHGEEVPEPVQQIEASATAGSYRAPIALPALTAAKLEVYRAMRQAGLDEAQLAQRLGWPPKKITHIFDGYHAIRLEQLEAALAAFGRRLVVTSEPV